MMTVSPQARERAQRRARHMIPKATPRRAEIIAALSVLVAVGGLSLAPAVAALGALFHLLSKATRWRPTWLGVPAGAGLAWALDIGPGHAVAAFAALPRAVAAAAGRPGAWPGALTAAAGLWRRDLPGQLPLALSLGAAAAAGAWGLDWLHTDEGRAPAVRPGLLAWRRGRAASARISRGGVLTRDGVCLGVDPRTGRQIGLSWREAGHGLLVTGATWPDVAGPAFQVLHAAIRRRMPVIAVDLSGDREVAAGVAAVCAFAGAPLQIFGPAGGHGYDPWRGGEPAQRAALAMALIDWAQAPSGRRSCQAWLGDIFAVIAAAPGDAGLAVLDDTAALTVPEALRARAEQVPAYHPRRAALIGRAGQTAALLEADQATADFLARQLRALREGTLGRWLGPAPGGAGSAGAAPGGLIRLADVVSQRGVALFPLGRAAHGHAADAIADVVALDAAALCDRLGASGAGADGLAWFGGCESADPAALGALRARGAGAGIALVTATASAQAAAALAEQAGAQLVRRPAGPGLEFSLAVREPAREEPSARFVAAGLPRPAPGVSGRLGGAA